MIKNLQDETPKDIKFLRKAFASEQVCLKAKLDSSCRITHHGDRGEVNEQFFIDFLRSYLPNRYTVEKAVVIDSNGAVSHSLDAVVFDRQYTPTLLDNDKHRYIPAEAVYAVFECKPKIDKGYLEYASEKVKSVRRLHRTSVDISHAGGTYKKKEPFHVIGGILASGLGWTDGLGQHFENANNALQGDSKIDCGFAASGYCFDTFDDGDLTQSYEYTYGPKENALAFFIFRFLSKLQSLGTVTAVDWQAYANSLGGEEL